MKSEVRLQVFARLGHKIEQPVPSLFTFNVADADFLALMGAVVDPVVTSIPGTKFRAEGALLVTHWGMSGPAVLKLSSHAARFLSENNYHTQVADFLKGLSEVRLSSYMAYRMRRCTGFRPSRTSGRARPTMTDMAYSM